MRKIKEFKGYRSILGYNSETGQFVTVPLPERDIRPGQERPEAPAAEIVPFPKSEPFERQSRKTG